MASDQDLIVTDNLTKHYGNRVGIDGVSLRIGAGELFGFLGPNGAGKSTTIRLLMGLLRPTSGRARIFAHDCWRQGAELRRDIGYLPGDLRLYSWLTLLSAIKLFGSIRRHDIRKSALELAEQFQLEPNLPVQKMSRGTRQKLGIILALAHRPKLLVLDEPTSGLDPIMQRQLADCLRERASAGHTVVFSSHTLREVEQLCDRVAIVGQGQIVADEALDSLRRSARRSVRIVFHDQKIATETPAPEFLSSVKRNGNSWTAELVGPSLNVLNWSRDQRIEDISIGEPDLESVFYQFYESPEDQSQ